MPRPPKKRRGELPEKIGKIRQHLINHFSILPDSLSGLRNGHLLLLHIMEDKSIARTIKAPVANLPCRISPAQLQSLVHRAKKFTTVTRDSDMMKYESLCSESYTLFDPALENPQPVLEPTELQIDERQPQPGTSASNPDTPLCRAAEPLKTPSSSVRSTPRQLLTPRKQKMKKRLEFVSQSRSALKERHAHTVKRLQAQLDTLKFHKIKHLNQDLARKRVSLAKKDAKIKQISIKFSDKCLAQDLVEMKRKCKAKQQAFNQEKET